MDPKDVLQSIIDNGGRCGRWCEHCPFSKLVKKPNGSYENCFTVIVGDRYQDGGYDAQYKEAAKSLLLDIIMEDMLEDD